MARSTTRIGVRPYGSQARPMGITAPGSWPPSRGTCSAFESPRPRSASTCSQRSRSARCQGGPRRKLSPCRRLSGGCRVRRTRPRGDAQPRSGGRSSPFPWADGLAPVAAPARHPRGRAVDRPLFSVARVRSPGLCLRRILRVASAVGPFASSATVRRGVDGTRRYVRGCTRRLRCVRDDQERQRRQRKRHPGPRGASRARPASALPLTRSR